MAAGREAERLAERGEWMGRGQRGPFQGLSQTWVLPGASRELSSLPRTQAWPKQTIAQQSSSLRLVFIVEFLVPLEAQRLLDTREFP